MHYTYTPEGIKAATQMIESAKADSSPQNALKSVQALPGTLELAHFYRYHPSLTVITCKCRELDSSTSFTRETLIKHFRKWFIVLTPVIGTYVDTTLNSWKSSKYVTEVP